MENKHKSNVILRSGALVLQNKPLRKKAFDWEHLEEIRNPRYVQYLVNSFDRELTEEQYVSEVQLLRGFSASKRNQYCPSKLRREYRVLKSKYGFFDL